MIKNIKDLWKQWVRATGFIHDDMDMCYKIFEAGAMCFAPELAQIQQAAVVETPVAPAPQMQPQPIPVAQPQPQQMAQPQQMKANLFNNVKL